ncbi:hypothetical protein W02_17760 [Nitrospira sp. KM1]|uniref:hypothetical protein n=1 Tax=Nitrospira sp. KM1 TaxID=1936990 RepID=UPI0013A7782C|nr:hypothetical protein [Nitrospira sp. KM1]BCA54636.1 hypothetical protein W02_17760 [Nitrospira sp. KM1]
MISPETLSTVLRGVQVLDRDTLTGLGFFESKTGNPAFLQAEISVLAPSLSQALGKASPKDMATFYTVVLDVNRKRAVTSGGIFIDNQRRLHLTLANCRSTPSGGQDYTSAMELDTRDEPLLPVSQHRFRTAFQPDEAWIKSSQLEKRPSFPAYETAYGDPAKTIVIDLNRIPPPA